MNIYSKLNRNFNNYNKYQCFCSEIEEMCKTEKNTHVNEKKIQEMKLFYDDVIEKDLKYFNYEPNILVVFLLVFGSFFGMSFIVFYFLNFDIYNVYTILDVEKDSYVGRGAFSLFFGLYSTPGIYLLHMIVAYMQKKSIFKIKIGKMSWGNNIFARILGIDFKTPSKEIETFSKEEIDGNTEYIEFHKDKYINFMELVQYVKNNFDI
ncbi:hypothetical protein [Phocoenobacter skyensis]|uniref:Uncharacterized protein n=1 Tax=Phocoenobacter skyensis TaxID=97481 RepID=A0A1H7UDM3_9PAST|nr:hypothetical protein [Pasteurella skyensis]MDP8184598.1 hypothetical protein [Pasteurella skyensis]QLB23583.1 hypothetical protein A6B44_10410 [Pasteurella skyensis]SEL95093.1 hypothetical protein SAMN05444853_10227 [Pasteurella skyensis]